MKRLPSEPFSFILDPHCPRMPIRLMLIVGELAKLRGPVPRRIVAAGRPARIAVLASLEFARSRAKETYRPWAPLISRLLVDDELRRFLDLPADWRSDLQEWLPSQSHDPPSSSRMGDNQPSTGQPGAGPAAPPKEEERIESYSSHSWLHLSEPAAPSPLRRLLSSISILLFQSRRLDQFERLLRASLAAYLSSSEEPLWNQVSAAFQTQMRIPTIATLFGLKNGAPARLELDSTRSTVHSCRPEDAGHWTEEINRDDKLTSEKGDSIVAAFLDAPAGMKDGFPYSSRIFYKTAELSSQALVDEARRLDPRVRYHIV